ncbi:hypothetical protein [Jannaschia ovalis]|uniref:Uncharacterized protein n=1 Tax=Jannaschia ovalis TaxID=3038773 RepID=A0ABY8LE48_9RHOB|nr:hypothetical protein [Jannaschia sp. GRR-S6-38]WGH79598.1 hypothetical protein P8627_04865 [Jannaschia sp. GRR-S6-38]
MRLAGDIERRLPIHARSQRAIRQKMLSLREVGRGTASERVGRLAARAGMLTREALASQCAAYRLALGALGLDPPEDVRAVMRKANSTAFATPLSDGTDVALSDLEASADGAFVEIEGFVTAIEALRLADGKLVSRLVLRDPSSDATANAKAVIAHLPHAGVTFDAFLRANGSFNAASALFDGQPAVEIDALSLEALGRASWRIAFLRLADRWFGPQPAEITPGMEPEPVHELKRQLEDDRERLRDCRDAADIEDSWNDYDNLRTAWEIAMEEADALRGELEACLHALNESIPFA